MSRKRRKVLKLETYCTDQCDKLKEHVESFVLKVGPENLRDIRFTEVQSDRGPLLMTAYIMYYKDEVTNG